MKKIATPEEAAKTTDSHNNTKPIKAPYKLEVALLLFIERVIQGVIQPEASYKYGESCLHTTVSDLYNGHGVCFKRKVENYTNRAGTISRFTRYSLLSDEDVLRAKKLINQYRASRGLSPLICEVAA